MGFGPKLSDILKTVESAFQTIIQNIVVFIVLIDLEAEWWQKYISEHNFARLKSYSRTLTPTDWLIIHNVPNEFYVAKSIRSFYMDNNMESWLKRYACI